MTTNPVTAGIAHLTGREELEVAMRLGGAWRRSELMFDPASDLLPDPADVFVFGEPQQLVAVRLFEGLEWAVGAAKIEWATQTPVLTMEGRVLWGAGDDLENKAVELRRLLLARRRAFEYCALCGEQTAPEQRFEDEICQPCSSEWLNVVY